MLAMIETDPITDPLLAAYEQRLQRVKRSPHTIRMHRQTARLFQSLLRELGKPAADVTPLEIEEWLEGLDLAPSSKKAHLRRLRASYRYAVRRGIATTDPTSWDIELEPIPDKEPRIIPNDELRRMKERAATDNEWALFHLLAFTGIRRCESIELDWDDVDLGGGTITIRQGKGNKLRHVPIHPQLGEVLVDIERRHPKVLAPTRGAQIGLNTFAKIIRTLSPQYTAHDFRRTVASSLTLNGTPYHLIDKIMGWAPKEVRSRYYVNVAPRELQRAILKLYADDPI